MARKKSVEELMLEAELSSPAGDSAEAKPKSKRNAEVSLGDIEQAERAARAEAGAAGEVEAEAVGNPGKGKARSSRIGSWAKRRRKRIAIGVAGVAVVAIAGVVIAHVAFWNSTDVWDGTSDTTWYSEGMTSMTITTAEQLAGMRDLCNEGTDLAGIRFRLGRNIDLYEIPTKPIADGRNEQGNTNDFRGSFDGTGHTISGLNIEEKTWDHAGLFGSVGDGDIENLTVEGKVTGQVRVGGIVGEMSGGSLKNCTNRCKVSSLKTATSYYPVQADVGGVCGIWLGISNDSDKAELANLVNEGEVSARACSAGGVIGSLANSTGMTVTVRDLENDASVTVYCESDERSEAVGGVIGSVGALGTDLMTNLVNNGEVSCSTVLSVGGVLGALMAPQREQKEEPKGEYTEGVELKSLSNSARVAANVKDERAHVGGIVGYLDDPDVMFDNCENTGELAATNDNADDICTTDGAEVWDEWEDTHPQSYFA